MRFLVVIFFNFWVFQLSCQENYTRLEKAVDQANFKKIKRYFKKEVRKHKKGRLVKTGTAEYVVHDETAEYLVKWFKSNSNVPEAHSDKCENHISVYPGWFSIGVIFQTKKGIAERTFTVQEGKTGNVHFFKWRFHLFKGKNVLVYKNMKHIPGFVQKQKWNCLQLEQKREIRDSIPIKYLIGKWKNLIGPKDIEPPPVVFQLRNYDLELVDQEHTYVFFRKVSPTAVLGNGIMINWPPYDCFVKQIDENHISIEYSFLGSEPVKFLFVRIDE